VLSNNSKKGSNGSENFTAKCNEDYRCVVWFEIKFFYSVVDLCLFVLVYCMWPH